MHSCSFSGEFCICSLLSCPSCFFFKFVRTIISGQFLFFIFFYHSAVTNFAENVTFPGPGHHDSSPSPLLTRTRHTRSRPSRNSSHQLKQLKQLKQLAQLAQLSFHINHTAPRNRSSLASIEPRRQPLSETDSPPKQATTTQFPHLNPPYKHHTITMSRTGYDTTGTQKPPTPKK